MRGLRRAPRLVIALAVFTTAYGALALIPHTHRDQGIPRFDTACTATSSPTPLFHLHRSAPLLPDRACLACLIGPGVAAVVMVGTWLVLLSAQSSLRPGREGPIRVAEVGLPVPRGPPLVLC